MCATFYFQPPFCASLSFFILSFAHTLLISFLFLFLGHIQHYQQRQQSQTTTNQKTTNYLITTTALIKSQDDSVFEVLRFDRNFPASKSATPR